MPLRALLRGPADIARFLHSLRPSTLRPIPHIAHFPVSPENDDGHQDASPQSLLEGVGPPKGPPRQRKYNQPRVKLALRASSEMLFNRKARRRTPALCKVRFERRLCSGGQVLSRITRAHRWHLNGTSMAPQWHLNGTYNGTCKFTHKTHLRVLEG